MFCKFCGKQIENNVRFCTECGKDQQELISNNYTNISSSNGNINNQKHWLFKKFNDLNESEKVKFKKFIASIIIIGVIFIIGIVLITSTFGIKSSKLTYENYQKISIGMTYTEVCKIFDSTGKESLNSDTYIDGYGNYSLKYFTWQNSSGTKIVIIGFENDRVIAKSQVGLT